MYLLCIKLEIIKHLGYYLTICKCIDGALLSPDNGGKTVSH